VRGRIQALTLEAVSLIIFESLATKFSMMITESTWTVRADES
jgi:hypothetical protein